MAIKTSLKVSTSSLLESDPQAVKLFLMIGLLPDLITISEIQQYWALSAETHKIEPICAKLESAGLIKLV